MTSPLVYYQSSMMADNLLPSEQADRIAGIPDYWHRTPKFKLQPEELQSGNFLSTMNAYVSK